MQIYCFYNNLDPRVRRSLEKFAPQCEYVDTSATQMTYAEELEKRWTGEESLMIVEHDKEIYADVVPQLESCDEPWCAYTYWLYPEPHTALCIAGFGVAKFSTMVQKLVRVEEFAGDQQLGIDRRFHDLLLSKGIGCHLHGHVVHHHVYEPRPLAIRQYAARLRAEGTMPPASAPPCPAPHLLPGSYDLTEHFVADGG